MKNVLKLIVLVLALAGMASVFSEDVDYAGIKTLSERAAELEKAGKFAAAAKCYKKLAKKQKDHRDRAQSSLKEADCLFAANKTHLAAKAYRAVMKEYALYLPFDHLVKNLRTLAENYATGNGTFLRTRDRREAIETYFFILTEAPAINVSLADRLRLAELLVMESRREEAVAVYQDILKMDPTLDDVRLQLALLLLDLCKSGDGDGAIRRSATRQAKFILERNPNYNRREEIELILADATEHEAERLLELGKFYLRKSHLRPDASKAYFIDLVQRFPGTKAAWEAKELLETDEHFASKESEGDQK